MCFCLRQDSCAISLLLNVVMRFRNIVDVLRFFFVFFCEKFMVFSSCLRALPDGVQSSRLRSVHCCSPMQVVYVEGDDDAFAHLVTESLCL